MPAWSWRVWVSPRTSGFHSDRRGDRDGTGRSVLDQDQSARIPVVATVDARLAEAQTGGWRYEDMPEDGQACRDSLTPTTGGRPGRLLPGLCRLRRGRTAAVTARGAGHRFGGLARDERRPRMEHVDRYPCTAFYFYPTVRNEIGFRGG